MYSRIYPIRLLQPSQLRSAEGMVYWDACKYSISRLSLHHIKNSPEFSLNNPNSPVCEKSSVIDFHIGKQTKIER